MIRSATLSILTALLAAAALPATAAAGPSEAKEAAMSAIDSARVDATVKALVDRHGPDAKARAERGVRQAAMFWRAQDGTPEQFQAFCESQFLTDPRRVQDLLDRFEKNLEALTGHAVALTRALREAIEVDVGEPLPVDLLFASLNPFDHVSDDSFKTRVAFTALLNFRLFTLPELAAEGPSMDRRQWAEARLASAFALRIPGEVKQATTLAYTEASDYIDNYNIHMHGVVVDGKQPFPEGLKLISHWGLRDHIKGLYADPKKNLPEQRAIQTVMERIIRQEIPAAVVDKAGLLWDPAKNTLAAADGAPIASAPREDDVRYARMLAIFKAERATDAWSPAFPTHFARKFGYEREIPEETVTQLLKDVLSAPVAKDVAKLIRKRLGRDLQPFDIWYDGFKARTAIPEEERDRAVLAKYPTIDAFQADLPGILGRLGFRDELARFLATKTRVDPARGAGHAMGAGMRSDDAHLRTRLPPKGMDYKGYNIAMHELGHTVEQVLTLNKVDRTLLFGVPNTAFTEAFAFVFQDRDLEVLGLAKRDDLTKALSAIDTYWMTFEIAGVGLLDVAMWHWMYDHPDATPAQLREAVVTEAIAIWNRYYAPVFGVKDSPLLAIYSHMICYGMYLPDYPIGHLIQFQYERQFEGKNLADEMERMCVQGRLLPDVWMRGAVGGPISAQPLVEAAAAALKVVKR